MNWSQIFAKIGVRQTTATRWAPVFAQHTPQELIQRGLADFLGQVLVESAMLERLEENLRYTTPQRICAVWPKRFPNAESAAPYVSNPEALANFVYGNRMGNVRLGDGYRYRGRGLLMVTGRSNYAVTGKRIGEDLEGQPELMAQPDIALRAALAWWDENIDSAQIGDVAAITKRVNGGTTALNERLAMSHLAEVALA